MAPATLARAESPADLLFQAVAFKLSGARRGSHAGEVAGRA